MYKYFLIAAILLFSAPSQAMKRKKSKRTRKGKKAYKVQLEKQKKEALKSWVNNDFCLHKETVEKHKFLIPSYFTDKNVLTWINALEEYNYSKAIKLLEKNITREFTVENNGKKVSRTRMYNPFALFCYAKLCLLTGKIELANSALDQWKKKIGYEPQPFRPLFFSLMGETNRRLKKNRTILIVSECILFSEKIPSNKSMRIPFEDYLSPAMIPIYIKNLCQGKLKKFGIEYSDFEPAAKKFVRDGNQNNIIYSSIKISKTNTPEQKIKPAIDKKIKKNRTPKTKPTLLKRSLSNPSSLSIESYCAQRHNANNKDRTKIAFPKRKIKQENNIRY